MLTLTAELFLLSLSEKRNSIRMAPMDTLPYALAGAMLVELALSGKIVLEKDKRVLPVEGAQPGEDARLNDLLQKIQAAPKPRKITHWIMLAANKSRKLEKDLLNELIASGVIREEEKRILWVIPYMEYSEKDGSAKYLRKQQLRDIALAGKPADQQAVALFSLLKSIDMLGNIFTPDEIKAAESRVLEIIKDEAVGEAVIDTLNAISFAAVAAASAATSMC